MPVQIGPLLPPGDVPRSRLFALGDDHVGRGVLEAVRHGPLLARVLLDRSLGLLALLASLGKHPVGRIVLVEVRHLGHHKPGWPPTQTTKTSP